MRGFTSERDLARGRHLPYLPWVFCKSVFACGKASQGRHSMCKYQCLSSSHKSFVAHYQSTSASCVLPGAVLGFRRRVMVEEGLEEEDYTVYHYSHADQLLIFFFLFYRTGQAVRWESGSMWLCSSPFGRGRKRACDFN